MTEKFIEQYQSITKDIQKELDLKNIHQAPKLEKIVISMGLKAHRGDNATKKREKIAEELALITGQKPIMCAAKKSESGFKLREGEIVGIKVTLRKNQAKNFMARFINLTCPNIRDFRGFKRRGDKMGSYSIGLDSQQVFLELQNQNVTLNQGMNITFVTNFRKNVKNNAGEEVTPEVACLALMDKYNFPFKRGKK